MNRPTRKAMSESTAQAILSHMRHKEKATGSKRPEKGNIAAYFQTLYISCEQLMDQIPAETDDVFQAPLLDALACFASARIAIHEDDSSLLAGVAALELIASRIELN